MQFPNIPEKISTNSRDTSPNAINTARNKRLLVCTTKYYLKNFILTAVPGNIDYANIIRNGQQRT